MSKAGKRKFPRLQVQKMFTSHDPFYPKEYKSPPKPGEYGLMPIPR